MQIDSTKPHIGRVYDYVLGGHHNFDVDRAMANHIMELMPSYPKWARLNRWFLQMVAEQWASDGHSRVLDLASGLPTQGHMHESIPGARILYSDNDMLSVTYGQQLVAQVPNVEYRLADLTKPETLIQEASAFFGDERQVTIGCIGVSYMLDDLALERLAQLLHDWSAPGSVMALTFIRASDRPEHLERMAAINQRFAQMGAYAYFRTTDQLAQLLAPWRIVTSQPLADWLGIDETAASEDTDSMLYKMFGILLEY